MRQVESGEENAAGVNRVGTRVGRREQVFEVQRVFVLAFAGETHIAEEHRFLLAEEIDDAIAGYAKEPAGDVVDGHQQAVGFHEFVEDVLENVLGVAGIGDAPADEIEEPGAFLIHDLGDSLILICHRPEFTERCVHLPVETDERGRILYGGGCLTLRVAEVEGGYPSLELRAKPPLDGVGNAAALRGSG